MLSDFPIPHEGLISKLIINENKILINLPNNQLIFPDGNNIKNVISARCQKIVTINVDKQINEHCILIYNRNKK